jgi:hypothetical protein
MTHLIISCAKSVSIKLFCRLLGYIDTLTKERRGPSLEELLTQERAAGSPYRSALHALISIGDRKLFEELESVVQDIWSLRTAKTGKTMLEIFSMVESHDCPYSNSFIIYLQ